MTKVKLSPQREALLVLDTQITVGRAKLADAQTNIGRAVVEGKDVTAVVKAYHAFARSIDALEASAEKLRRETNEKLN